MAWRDTMQQVLQGVMLPPQIPTNFQQPQSGIPLPPLGKFGMEALNMAGLPSSIPRRMVTPAQLIRSLPPGAQVPGGGGGGAEDYGSPGGGTINDILNGGMIPPTTEMGTPIVAGEPSRMPHVDPAPPPQINYSEPMDPNAPAPAYVPDAPYTYPTPPASPESPYSVPVPPPHMPSPFTDENQMIPYAPEPEPVAPWAPVVPGSTTTEHSTITNPGATVGDLMGGSSSDSRSVGEWFSDPFASAADALTNMVERWGDGWKENPMDSPSQYVDPTPSYDYSYSDPNNFDPFDMSKLTRAQRQYLYDIGYLRDA